MSPGCARIGRVLVVVAASAAGACAAFSGDEPETPATPASPSSSGPETDAGLPATDGALPSGDAEAGADPAPPVAEAGAADAASSVCPSATCRFVFVTTSQFPGTTLEKPIPNDQECAVLAAKNPAFAGRSFQAWLSYQNRNAGSILGATPKIYRLADGTLVANDNADFLSGRVRHAIDRDEMGGLQLGSGRVWTGTSNAGGLSQNCQDWTDPGLSAVVGDLTSGDGWSSVATELCSLSRPIYCVQTAP